MALMLSPSVLSCAAAETDQKSVATSLYGGDMPAVLRMKSIHVRGNAISGRSFTHANENRVCPIGIKVQILRPTYEDLRFEDNTLDLPDFGDAVYLPQEAFAQSMMYFPLALWAEATKSGHVLYRGNRNPAGKPLYPFLVDWYFANSPAWGKPETSGVPGT